MVILTSPIVASMTVNITKLANTKYDKVQTRTTLPLTKMLWSVSIKTRTFAAVNTCNGSF